MPGVARVGVPIVGYDQRIWLGEYQVYQDTSLGSTETLGHSSQWQDSVILLPANWQILLTLRHCSSTRPLSQYLGWLILGSAQPDGILEKFPNFWNSNSVLFISESEYWRVKNVNSWKISVGDSWIVDIYGNLKTFDGWWLKVKATLSGAVEILWNITKLLRIILTIKPKIWLTNESPEMYLTI